MENYEEEIAFHNPNLYEAIKEYMPMPDFRPQETVKQMRFEHQNDWRLLYHELASLQFDDIYQALVEAINSGDVNEILPFLFIDDTSLVSDFIFSYPALTWAMMKTSPEDTIIPLLINQGVYLEKIPMKRKFIPFIRDKKAAKYLAKKYPLLMKNDPHEIFSIGEIYWYRYLFPSSFKENVNEIFKQVVRSKDLLAIILILRREEVSQRTLISSLWNLLGEHHSLLNEDIILEILPFIDYDSFNGPGLWRLKHTLPLLIQKSYSRALEEFLKRAKFNRGDVYTKTFPLNNSVYIESIVKVLLKDERITDKGILLNFAVNKRNLAIINEFLFDKKHDWTEEIGEALSLAVENKDKEMINILIQYPSIDTRRAIYSASAEGDLDIMDLLLSYPKIDSYFLVNRYLFSAVERESRNDVVALLKYPHADPTRNDNDLLKKALRHGHDEIIDVLLDDDDVSKTVTFYDLKFALEYNRNSVDKIVYQSSNSNMEIIRAIRENRLHKVISLWKDEYKEEDILLTFAAWLGHYEIVKMLMKEYNLYSVDALQYTVYSYIDDKDKIETVKLLLNHPYVFRSLTMITKRNNPLYEEILKDDNVFLEIKILVARTVKTVMDKKISYFHKKSDKKLYDYINRLVNNY